MTKYVFTQLLVLLVFIFPSLLIGEKKLVQYPLINNTDKSKILDYIVPHKNKYSSFYSLIKNTDHIKSYQLQPPTEFYKIINSWTKIYHSHRYSAVPDKPAN